MFVTYAEESLPVLLSFSVQHGKRYFTIGTLYSRASVTTGSFHYYSPLKANPQSVCHIYTLPEEVLCKTHLCLCQRSPSTKMTLLRLLLRYYNCPSSFESVLGWAMFRKQKLATVFCGAWSAAHCKSKSKRKNTHSRSEHSPHTLGHTTLTLSPHFQRTSFLAVLSPCCHLQGYFHYCQLSFSKEA